MDGLVFFAALAAEYAQTIGWNAAALLSDLRKAYENIDHEILWREATATGFHLGLLHQHSQCLKTV